MDNKLGEIECKEKESEILSKGCSNTKFDGVNQLTIDPSQRNNTEEWQRRKLVSKFKNHYMRSSLLLASFDQMAMEGRGACSVIAALSADWLLSSSGELPTQVEFDRLITEGSETWRSLQLSATPEDALNHFFFHIDTIVQAGVGSITIDIAKSHFASFGPDAGDASVDNVWNKLAAEEEYPRVYIVRWNNHFFVLKVESGDVFYVMDSLGRRFSNRSTWNKGYIIRFDLLSKVFYQKPNSGWRWMVGKEGSRSCLEFLRIFFAAQVLRGRRWDEVGDEMMQIDFNYVRRAEEPPVPPT